jgi:hypothetical protein
MKVSQAAIKPISGRAIALFARGILFIEQDYPSKLLP